MKTILKTVLLVTTIILTSCSNNDDIPQDQLPPITQTGANTFGCVINEEVLTPKDRKGIPQPRGLDAGRDPNGNFYILSSNLQDDNGLYMYIYKQSYFYRNL